jgi:NDP-sugar pyrophosphorylase family protein
MSVPAGVIAAGEGSRLARSHPGVVKPLVPVAGRPLSHWVIGGLRGAGARRITVLTNSRGTAVPPSLRAAFADVAFDFLSADTASSYESFRLVARRLARDADAFLVSTIDALIPAAEIARFWESCASSRPAAGLALTAYVDDENPLWADVDGAGLVTAVGDDARLKSRVTCGLYYLTRDAAARLPEPSTHARLRDFWRSLVASRARVLGVDLTKTLDVDRPEDVAAAEEFLATESPR